MINANDLFDKETRKRLIRYYDMPSIILRGAFAQLGAREQDRLAARLADEERLKSENPDHLQLLRIGNHTYNVAVKGGRIVGLENDEHYFRPVSLEISAMTQLADQQAIQAMAVSTANGATLAEACRATCLDGLSGVLAGLVIEGGQSDQ